MTQQQEHLKSIQGDVWHLKPITFGSGESKKQTKIITQNFNGPCSFIAICNILILRGNIEILPVERTNVSYELLSQLVGEYLLTSAKDVDISAALSMMPSTIKGMDLNPVFTGARSFRPAGDGGELKLFEQAGIDLVHGWLVDPDSHESKSVAKFADYDSAVNLIVDADHTTKGQLVVADDEQGQSSQAGFSSKVGEDNWTDEERLKIEDAMSIRLFLESSQTQLTYHGLFTLSSLLTPGSLVALFRSSHLSVLYKSPEDSSLYTLVSDAVFLRETSVVWERLEDVDGGWSTFVDGDFVKSSPAGGDFAGETADSALRASEMDIGQFSAVDPADQALAQQLQAEEDAHAQQVYARQQQEHQEKQRQQQLAAQARSGRRRVEGENGRNGEKKDKCIIM